MKSDTKDRKISDETKKDYSKKSDKLKSSLAKLKEENSKLKSERDEFKDKLLRLAAEFDNYKKRSEKEYLNLIQSANERLILSILPVIDDLERSLNHLEDAKDINALGEGFKLIYKNLMVTLEKQGLKTMNSIGEAFDPEKHDALLQIEKEGIESNKIVDEHLKGYLLNDKVIRHAQVIVAK